MRLSGKAPARRYRCYFRRVTARDRRRFGKSPKKSGEFSISIDPSAEFAMGGAVRARAGEGWLELLVNGLTFDVVGLSPGKGAEQPACVHSYSLPAGSEPFGLEAVTVRPGPHLAGGQTMAPVLRSLA
jgi:hypothetical protein